MRLNLSFSKFIIKPFLATIMMAICSYATYLIFQDIVAERIATAIALVSAVIVYILALLVLRVLTKEDINMLPYGSKIYDLLYKSGIYNEK